MKATNKMDGDAFARQLVAEASSKNTRVIVAQENVDIKDEAKQSAQAYWMMGWTWDEIESVLEDSEYPKNVITYAIKETKEYAKKILNEGPFAVLQAGQTIKLIDGSVGTLKEKFADHIAVDIDNIGTVHVTANQLDINGTEKLREAYIFRMKANNMLYKLSTDILEHVSIESQTLDPILESINKTLATMSSLKQDSDEVKREATILHNKWKNETNTWQPSSKEENDFAQYLYATLGSEQYLNTEINTEFHENLGTVLAKVYDKLNEGPIVSNADFLEFLNNTFPKIANALEGHLYGVKQRNASIREYVQQFAKFGGKDEAEWKNNAVQFAITSWNQTKEFLEEWEKVLLPEINKNIKLILGFLADLNVKTVNASIYKAIKELKTI